MDHKGAGLELLTELWDVVVETPLAWTVPGEKKLFWTVEASGGNDGERGIGYEREKDTPPELMTCSEMRKETEMVKTCFKIALSQGCPIC